MIKMGSEMVSTYGFIGAVAIGFGAVVVFAVVFEIIKIWIKGGR